MTSVKGRAETREELDSEMLVTDRPVISEHAIDVAIQTRSDATGGLPAADAQVDDDNAMTTS